MDKRRSIMKTLSEVIAAFDPRRADENTIQDQFWSIAEVALYGGYFLVNEETRIYPVEIEFYLFVEEDSKGNWQRDANMYHKGKGVPYFPKKAPYTRIVPVLITPLRTKSRSTARLS